MENKVETLQRFLSSPARFWLAMRRRMNRLVYNGLVTNCFT